MEGVWRCANGRLMKKSLGLFLETIGNPKVNVKAKRNVDSLIGAIV